MSREKLPFFVTEPLVFPQSSLSSTKLADFPLISSFYPYANIIARKWGRGYGRLETSIGSGRDYQGGAGIAAHQGWGIDLIGIPPGIFREIGYIGAFPSEFARAWRIVIAGCSCAGTVGYKMVGEVFAVSGGAPSLPCEPHIARATEKGIGRGGSIQLIPRILARILNQIIYHCADIPYVALSPVISCFIYIFKDSRG